MKSCYGSPPPGIDLQKLSGILIVIEGPDSSGRSTQIRILSTWLEEKGYAVVQTGLTRSKLVGTTLAKAKEGNVLSPRTMSLFYATDFYDQLENSIVPALQAGYIVLADRYIFTLMARDMARGTESEWLETLYSKAIVPDAVFFLMPSSRNLVERTLTVRPSLDYWEAGMDIIDADNLYDSFCQYQTSMIDQFDVMAKEYKFHVIDANRSIADIHKDIKAGLEPILDR